MLARRRRFGCRRREVAAMTTMMGMTVLCVYTLALTWCLALPRSAHPADEETGYDQADHPSSHLSPRKLHFDPSHRNVGPVVGKSISASSSPSSSARRLAMEKNSSVQKHHRTLQFSPNSKDGGEYMGSADTGPLTQIKVRDTGPPTQIKVRDTGPLTQIKVRDTGPPTQIKVRDTGPPTQIKVRDTGPLTQIKVRDTGPPTEIKVRGTGPPTEIKVRDTGPLTEIKVRDTGPLTEGKVSHKGVKVMHQHPSSHNSQSTLLTEEEGEWGDAGWEETVGQEYQDGPMAMSQEYQQGSTVGTDGDQQVSSSRRLPGAIIIGVKKAGTRALLEFLRIHPDVQAPGPEPHFFDRNYNRGLDWYRSLMPATEEGQLTIEKTPSYFITREVPKRVRSMSRQVKLVVVVRDPVTRAISDYVQASSKRDGKMKRFEDMALLDYRLGIVNTSWGAIRIGVYTKHLDRWLKYFPRNQIHFVSGEQLIANPAQVMADVQKFLGLSHFITEKHFYLNATRGFPCLVKFPENNSKPHCLGKTKGRRHPDVDPHVIERLRDFYRPFNAKFYQMVGRDFGWS